MRKTAVAIALVLIASLGIIVPSAAAAVGDPKVVIIVGATHGATAGYRADADVAYAEAIKYTSNVVKVYSPNATWARVKAAHGMRQAKVVPRFNAPCRTAASCGRNPASERAVAAARLCTLKRGTTLRAVPPCRRARRDPPLRPCAPHCYSRC